VTALVEQPDVERLWDAIESDPSVEVTVDLGSKTVSWATRTVPFELDDYTRWRLMEGLDDIDLTLRHADEVSAYESRRPQWMPTTA
jgi:3-isopropylmalate/(R)-2-methylmalate dehydratase small subunit